MKILLDDGLAVLSDLLQSGAGSCHPETEERLEKLSRDWEDAGLHTGAALLSELAGALAARRHGGGRDPITLMALVGRAARYTKLCQQKYCLDAAGGRLCREDDQEEDE